MNTESLPPLTARWPKDQVLIKRQPDMDEVPKLLSTPRGKSIYQDDLIIDPTDSQTIAQFAAANNMTYATTFSYNPVTVPAWLGRHLNTTMPLFVHEVNGQIFGYTVTFCAFYEPSSTQGGPSSTTNDPRIDQFRLTRKSVLRVKLPKTFPQLVLD
jgi:hypothetical protein